MNLFGADLFRDVSTVALGADCGDAELAHLKGLSHLEALSLYRSKVTDAGLAHLRGMANLKQLFLDRTQVTDAALEHLNGLTNLQELEMRNTRVTAEGVQKLQRALPNCYILY